MIQPPPPSPTAVPSPYYGNMMQASPPNVLGLGGGLGSLVGPAPSGTGYAMGQGNPFSSAWSPQPGSWAAAQATQAPAGTGYAMGQGNPHMLPSVQPPGLAVEPGSYWWNPPRRSNWGMHPRRRGGLMGMLASLPGLSAGTNMFRPFG